jgi:quinol monooxygenase YgiN
MIKIVAKNYVKQDKINRFITLAKELVAETQKNDEGCIHYDLFQDLKDPQILTIIEEWESQDALDKHRKAKHFTEIVPQFGELTEKSGELNLYRIVE